MLGETQSRAATYNYKHRFRDLRDVRARARSNRVVNGERVGWVSEQNGRQAGRCAAKPDRYHRHNGDDFLLL